MSYRNRVLLERKESGNMRCEQCNKMFDPNGSPSRSQVIWVRFLVMISGVVFQVKGSICSRCNNELRTHQVWNMSVSSEV